MFDKFQSRLNLKGEVETLTAIRIGAGRSTSPVSSDLPVVRDAANHPYIPGSSFKGVFRSYLESVLRSFTDDRCVVCNPTNEKEQCITREEMETLRKKRDDQLILNQICWVCQLFGASWYASKLQIRDLHVRQDLWFDQYQQRDGVAIETRKRPQMANFTIMRLFLQVSYLIFTRLLIMQKIGNSACCTSVSLPLKMVN